MVTKFELLFCCPDAKINLWSQQLKFGKTFSDFLFLDIFKMSIFHFSKKVLRKKLVKIEGPRFFKLLLEYILLSKEYIFYFDLSIIRYKM